MSGSSEAEEDENLMLRYIDGDDGAFGELYRRYQKNVYGFLVSRVDRSDADELFQQTFLKLHKSRELYDPGKPFVTWLFAICRNVLKDHYRWKGRHPEAKGEELSDIHASVSPYSVNFSQVAMDELMAQLPPKQQQVIRLRFEQGLEFEEIAGTMRTTKANARQLLSRSLKALRELFGVKRDK